MALVRRAGRFDSALHPCSQLPVDSCKQSASTPHSNLPGTWSTRIRPSVGRTGVCWDNVWVESFNATLKNERVHHMVYPTREKAINNVSVYNIRQILIR